MRQTAENQQPENEEAADHGSFQGSLKSLASISLLSNSSGKKGKVFSHLVI